MVVSFLRSPLIIFCLVGTLLLPLPVTRALAGEDVAAPSAAASPVAEGVEGIAAYYAKRFNGRRTNSGHRYDPEKLTAAHPTLPHGTRVRVINLHNGKDVVVTINDRCRPRKRPFIDLSRAAARALGFLGKGSTPVRIIPLTEES